MPDASQFTNYTRKKAVAMLSNSEPKINPIKKSAPFYYARERINAPTPIVPYVAPPPPLNPTVSCFYENVGNVRNDCGSVTADISNVIAFFSGINIKTLSVLGYSSTLYSPTFAVFDITSFPMPTSSPVDLTIYFTIVGVDNITYNITGVISIAPHPYINFNNAAIQPIQSSPASTTVPFSSGGSIYFPNSNAISNIATNSAYLCAGISPNYFIAPSSDFTIMFWFYGSSSQLINNYAGRILSQGLFSELFSLQINTNGNGISEIAMDYYGSNVITSSSVNIADKWSHIAVIRKTNTITIYVNGISVGSAVDSTELGDNNSALIIGNSFDLMTCQNALAGFISKLYFDNQVGLYSSNFTPPVADPTPSSSTRLLLLASNLTNVAQNIGTVGINVKFFGYSPGNTPGFSPNTPAIAPPAPPPPPPPSANQIVLGVKSSGIVTVATSSIAGGSYTIPVPYQFISTTKTTYTLTFNIDYRFPGSTSVVGSKSGGILWNTYATTTPSTVGTSTLVPALWYQPFGNVVTITVPLGQAIYLMPSSGTYGDAWDITIT